MQVIIFSEAFILLNVDFTSGRLMIPQQMDLALVLE
jgi:hypothetical protein